MTAGQFTTGPGADLPSPIAAAIAVALTILAAGLPVGLFTPRHRPRRHADRTLYRLARKATVKPDHRAATDDPQRDPEWCHRHGCHSSQCPQGGGH